MVRIRPLSWSTSRIHSLGSWFIGIGWNKFLLLRTQSISLMPDGFIDDRRNMFVVLNWCKILLTSMASSALSKFLHQDQEFGKLLFLFFHPKPLMSSSTLFRECCDFSLFKILSFVFLSWCKTWDFLDFLEILNAKNKMGKNA